MKWKFHLPTKKKRQVAEVPSQTPYASPEIHQDDTGKNVMMTNKKHMDFHIFPGFCQDLGEFIFKTNRPSRCFFRLNKDPHPDKNRVDSGCHCFCQIRYHIVLGKMHVSAYPMFNYYVYMM